MPIFEESDRLKLQQQGYQEVTDLEPADSYPYEDSPLVTGKPFKFDNKNFLLGDLSDQLGVLDVEGSGADPGRPRLSPYEMDRLRTPPMTNPNLQMRPDINAPGFGAGPHMEPYRFPEEHPPGEIFRRKDQEGETIADSGMVHKVSDQQLDGIFTDKPMSQNPNRRSLDELPEAEQKFLLSQTRRHIEFDQRGDGGEDGGMFINKETPDEVDALLDKYGALRVFGDAEGVKGLIDRDPSIEVYELPGTKGPGTPGGVVIIRKGVAPVSEENTLPTNARYTQGGDIEGLPPFEVKPDEARKIINEEGVVPYSTVSPKTVQDFFSGGLVEVLKNKGVDVPDWMSSVGDFFKREDVNVALGNIGGMGAKTANLSAMRRATALDRQGFPSEEIWQQTGWFKGVDNKWKFEIPTQDAKFSIPGKNSGDLEEFLHFPQLYRAYPEFKNTKIAVNNKLPAIAMFDTDTGNISVNLRRIEETQKLFGDKQKEISPLRAVLHEIQHAIQVKEGFNFGSSPSLATKQFKQDYHELWTAAKTKEERKWLSDLKTKSDLDPNFDIGTFLYTRNPGERESNTVMFRNLYTEAERRAKSPLKTMKEVYSQGPETRYPESPMITTWANEADVKGTVLSNPKWTPAETQALEDWVKKGNHPRDLPIDKTPNAKALKARAEGLEYKDKDKPKFLKPTNEEMAETAMEMWMKGATYDQIATEFNTTRGVVAGLISRNRGEGGRGAGNKPRGIRQSAETLNDQRPITGTRGTPSLPRLKFLEEPFDE